MKPQSTHQHMEGRIIYDDKLPFSEAILTTPSSFPEGVAGL